MADFVYCLGIDLAASQVVTHNNVFLLKYLSICRFFLFIHAMMHFCVNDLDNQYIYEPTDYWLLTSVFVEIFIFVVLLYSIPFRFVPFHFDLNANIVTFCWPTKSFRVKCSTLWFFFMIFFFLKKKKTVNSFILVQMCMLRWRKNFKTFYFDWNLSKNSRRNENGHTKKKRSYDTVLWITHKFTQAKDIWLWPDISFILSNLCGLHSTHSELVTENVYTHFLAEMNMTNKRQ